MDIYDLERTPRQQFPVARGSDIYTLTFKGFLDCTVVDVLKNDVPVFYGAKCLLNKPLLPKQYTKSDKGYFALIGVSDIVPLWTDFGDKVTLAWIDNE